MAGELKSVRTLFIESVSLKIIQQLVDDLLDVNALNDGEHENILEGKGGRADKARALIDSVRKKGDKASWFIITSLKKRDPLLFENLGLPGPPHATPKANWWSTNLNLCKNSFWNSKKNDSEIYPVTKESVRSRVALLITNIKFEDTDFDRPGAEVDERNMQRLLEDLGYEVVKHTNLTGQEMDTAVFDFSKHSKLKDTDSVFVVIMSHGILGSILGVNWNNTEKSDVFPIDNIYKHLNSKNCRALIDKPKIIIIQACRGNEPGAVALGDDPGPLSSAGAGGSQSVHIEKDFAPLLSCTPDTKAYRDNVKGSLLIRFFVGIVNTHACEKELHELFRMIMRCFEREEFVTAKQMPVKDRWSMTKAFYLFPGI
ncbi:caspase a-like isoform X2 [Syngnathus typhle]|uniref:caspase a-like isoform X1 n=1 Tax=Syngnathus typhle TaxID=161592 RepID=UPI002A69BD67|nr:caspase a-like isoform X1 [Syngnathus typhle]XP_061136721.1 caspase a-like isoform X2 [Syngnathus typhle]